MRVEATVFLSRPLEEVFAYLTNLENDASWRREWIEAKKVSDGPIGIGSRFRLVGSALGRRFNVDYETIAYEQGRMASWKGLNGPMPLTFHRTFDAADGGTRVNVVYEGTLPMLLRPLGPLAVRAGRRAWEGDIPKLREVLEGAPA